MNDPIDVFREWRAVAAESGRLAYPSAMCVSTVASNGNPDARFVDLKAVRDEGFVFCTSFDSPKSEQLAANRHVALTFWWDHVGRQIRVLGTAHRISDSDADRLWAERKRDAQLATWAFEQSTPLAKNQTREQILDLVRQRFPDGPVPRPAYWGGFLVAPHRVEFLTFDESRVHRRQLYELQLGEWMVSELQP